MDDVQRKEALLLAVRVLTGGAADFAIAMPKAALPAAAKHLVQLARDVAASADACHLDSSDLRAAAKALSQADADSTSRAISDLVRACLRLDGLAAKRDAAAEDDLRRVILDVAMAGATLLRLRVLHTRGLDFLLAAAEGGPGGEVPEADADDSGREAELARERETELERKRETKLKREARDATAETRWWRRLANRFSRSREANEAARATGCWWRLASWFPKKEKASGGKGLHEEDLEAFLIARQVQPVPRPSPSPCPSDSSPPWGNWLSIQTFGLAGSLSLLPYMGPAVLLGKDFSDNYRWWVHLVFQIWWGLVIMGVPCALCGRSRIEEQYARFATHLGMLGITVNIIMFSHWMLAANAVYTMWTFLGLAGLCFIGYWIRCCMVGEV